MIRYRALAPTYGKHDMKGEPITQFNGTTCGVRFTNGEAFFDDITIRKDYKRSALEAATTMATDFGYTVSTIDEEGLELPFVPQGEPALALQPVPVGPYVSPAPKPKRAPRKARA